MTGRTGWTPARAGKPVGARGARRLARVDPRSRGEAVRERFGITSRTGGPPLARGSQRQWTEDELDRGWTPARAGKPRSRSFPRRRPWVDPRSRGEAELCIVAQVVELGGPPLARGSRAQDAPLVRGKGWTPARAGKPREGRVTKLLCRVDPRSRGEALALPKESILVGGGPPLARGSPRGVTEVQADDGWTPARAGKPWTGRARSRLEGVDPRSRGEAAKGYASLLMGKGGPPLARGSRLAGLLLGGGAGWTPARAGKPPTRANLSRGSWVDPRSRGEAFTSHVSTPRIPGGPPLARGSLTGKLAASYLRGWTPARAGKPTQVVRHDPLEAVDPRSRGEASSRAKAMTSESGGPPLARGSHPRECVGDLAGGWTPARAGKPPRPASCRSASRVDPRSRGEAALDLRLDEVPEGGPPLARGSRHRRQVRRVVEGWTPARAGKPSPRRRLPVPVRVDPRSRGEAWARATRTTLRSGGPPLARGSQARSGARQLGQGWTPARAGKPPSPRASSPRSRVDPRSRGEAHG